MEDLKFNKLLIKIEEDGELVRVIWSGVSDDMAPGKVINPYLSSLLESIGKRKVSIELYPLEFMNSSTVPPIIQFIKLCSNKNLDILILYSESKEWQRFSFKSFETFALVYKNLKIESI